MYQSKSFSLPWLDDSRVGIDSLFYTWIFVYICYRNLKKKQMRINTTTNIAMHGSIIISKNRKTSRYLLVY